MKLQSFLASSVLAASALAASLPASAQTVLTGDTRLACEAILCLASGNRPDECEPSLRRFFDISHRRLSRTLDARRDFLNLCPTSNQTPEMSELVNAIANGAGRCDARSLNTTLRFRTYGDDDGPAHISDQLPSYCSAYTTHAYTDLTDTLPRYVGTVGGGGFWVEASDYDRVQAQFTEARNAARAAEAARRNHAGN